ncbi:MAG: PDZ domain-containing protein [Terracidiphilus sp.]
MTKAVDQTLGVHAGQTAYAKLNIGFTYSIEMVPRDKAGAELASVRYDPSAVAEKDAQSAKHVDRARFDFEKYKQASGLDFAPAQQAASTPDGPAPGTVSAEQEPQVQARASHGSLFSAVSSSAGPSLVSSVAAPAPARRATAAPEIAPSENSSIDDANSHSNPSTMESAQSRLEALGDKLPAGIYTLDNEEDFNVLDSIYYDPATGQLSLVGHLDPRFQGPHIPYLQHLAVLLESPKPEFTLTWTPDSAQRVDALLNRHLSEQEGENITDHWGKLVDGDGQITRAGRYLLPALGVSPIAGSGVPGSLGIQVTDEGLSGMVRISQVSPDSPAASAGLKVGDLIQSIQGKPALNPDEFNRTIRFTGAGAVVNLVYITVVNGAVTTQGAQVTLAESPDLDVWDHTDVYDVLRGLYLAQGDRTAADVAVVVGILARFQKAGLIQGGTPSPEGAAFLQFMFDTMGVTAVKNADVQAVQSGSMTMANAENDIFLKLCQAFDSSLHFDGNPIAATYQRGVQQTNNPQTSLDPAFNEIGNQLKLKVPGLLDPLFERPQGVQIPPELVEDEFHVRPEMTPEYLGIPADSLLARAMFAGDYLCKRLMNRPELKQKIPGYLTGFEFEQAHPAFRHSTGNYRLWISVARMDTPQSPDGKILAFRDVRMRFNIREQSDSGRDLPNQPGSYEELLTSLWDNFEQEYPTLHELREAAKLAAAAKWIRQHNADAALPNSGRILWQGPGQVPGLVFIELTPDATQGIYKSHETIIATGGVSLTPFPQENVNNPNINGQAGANPFPYDSSVVNLTGLGSPAGSAQTDTPLTPMLFSHSDQDSLASRIFHEKIVVPEPHLPGWCGEFTKGKDTLRAISVSLNQLNTASDHDTELSLQQRQKLEQVRLVAIHLAQVERLLNILDEKSAKQTHDFLELQEEIAEQRKEFYEHFFDFSIDNMLEARYELKEFPDIAGAGDFAAGAKDNIDYLEELEASLKTGSLPVGTLEASAATIKRFSEGLSQISHELGATPAATYFDTVTEAQKFEDAFAVEGEFAQLEFVTDYKVESLSSSSDSVANLKSKLLPLQKKLTDQLDTLIADPQLKGLTAAGKTGN